MTNGTYLPDYEINEKDIDSALEWLKKNDPANATPEGAIQFIVDLRNNAHQNLHDSTDEERIKLYKELKREDKTED